MDSLHAVGFYASSAVALAGALLVAVLPGRGTRALALLAAGVGVAGIDASLSAGFTAAVVLLTFAGCAALLARHDYRSFDFTGGLLWRQLGAIGAAMLLVALAYAAYRGNFAHVTFNGGPLGTAAVGRLLFARDAVATEAVGVLVLIALVCLTVVWRLRERGER
jgi:NADH:ubiquinone oxidoreductase subunit 6 (subunit J)